MKGTLRFFDIRQRQEKNQLDIKVCNILPAVRRNLRTGKHFIITQMDICVWYDKYRVTLSTYIRVQGCRTDRRLNKQIITDKCYLKGTWFNAYIHRATPLHYVKY